MRAAAGLTLALVGVLAASALASPAPSPSSREYSEYSADEEADDDAEDYYASSGERADGAEEEALADDEFGALGPRRGRHVDHIGQPPVRAPAPGRERPWGPQAEVADKPAPVWPAQDFRTGPRLEVRSS